MLSCRVSCKGMESCAGLCHAVLCRAVLCCVVGCLVALRCTTVCCDALCCAVLCCVVLCCAVPCGWSIIPLVWRPMASVLVSTGGFVVRDTGSRYVARWWPGGVVWGGAVGPVRWVRRLSVGLPFFGPGPWSCVLLVSLSLWVCCVLWGEVE